MSNRQLTTIGVTTFEPALERKPEPKPQPKSQPPSAWLLALGVVYPVIVIGIELVTQICAQTFFDPMPTWGHMAAIAFVPMSNFVIWMYLEHGGPWSVKWLAFANGVAIAIATVYALLFLPLVPLAVVGILVGIGLLPLAPLAAFVSALRLRTALARTRLDGKLGRPLLGGLAAGLVFLVALDVPPSATRIGIRMAASDVPAERERGLALLRSLGDDDLLLRLCYEAARQPTGLLSAFATLGSNQWPRQRQADTSPAVVREIYYRMHGVAFNARPAPGTSTVRVETDTQVDRDHGGTQVGGRVPGLTLASSRLDGSISGDDLVGYLEWTIEFRNASALDREARLQLALPPGGVVSRATLWVNGEEREAAYGGRGEVRAAYQRVAVVQRRDPLLVTTKGADRVLAQAFPVGRSGGTIKFKIGITAPLDLSKPGKARLTLPAIIDRNFSIGSNTSHSVWIESRQLMTTSLPELTASPVGAVHYRVSGALSDRDLSGLRQSITVSRNPGAGSRTTRFEDGERVVQEITRGEPTRALMLVVDSSARVATTRSRLVAALEAIPPGVKVGAIIAADQTRRVPLAPWSDAQKAAIAKLIRSTTFVGGQDNAPALAEALQLLEPEPHAMLLWVHGPQPVSFHGSAAWLEQATARLSRLPAVTLYSVEPGPNELLPDSSWAWGARSLPQTGAPQADLAGFFARTFSPDQAQVVRRLHDAPGDGAPAGSEHIARLWANDRVLDMMRTGGSRADAVALAARYHLVTPVSGAVVLETQQQYEESRLTPVAQTTVPTVPEPHEWALLALAFAALMWLAWRRRHRFAGGAGGGAVAA